MDEKKEKELFTIIPDKTDSDVNAEDIEFDESILNDDFADMLRNGLDAAFDKDEICVSDELFAKTLAAIEKEKQQVKPGENSEKIKTETALTGGKSIKRGMEGVNENITPIPTKRAWWKRLTPVAVAVLILGLGIFYIKNMGYIGQKSDSATANSATSAFDNGIKDKERKYSPQSERNDECEDGASEMYLMPGQSDGAETAPTETAEYASKEAEATADSSSYFNAAESCQDINLIIDSDTAAKFTEDCYGVKDEDRKSYTDKWISGEESEELLAFLESEAVPYYGDDEKYTSEVADGLKAILYLYSENILLSKRYLCYEDRVIVISRENSGEQRKIYILNDMAFIDSLINK